MLGCVLLPLGAGRYPRAVPVVILVTTIATRLNQDTWSIGFHGSGFFKVVPRTDALVAAIAMVIL